MAQSVKARSAQRFRWLIGGFVLLLVVLTVTACGGSDGSTSQEAASGPSEIAFVSDRDGSFEIYVMSADGSNLVNLTNNPAGDFDPAW